MKKSTNDDDDDGDIDSVTVTMERIVGAMSCLCQLYFVILVIIMIFGMSYIYYTQIRYVDFISFFTVPRFAREIRHSQIFESFWHVKHH